MAKVKLGAFFKEYFKLNKTQRSFLRKKVIEDTKTIEEWVALFERPAKMDYLGDISVSGVFTIGIILFTVPAFITFLLYAFTQTYFTLDIFLFAVIFLTPLGFIILMIAWFVKSTDVPNHLRDFVLPLLFILSKEIRPNSILFLKVDIRPKVRKDNRLSIEKNFKRSLFSIIMPILLLLMIFTAPIGVFYEIDFFIFTGVFGSFIVFFVWIFGSLFLAKYPQIITTQCQYDWFEMKARLADNSRFMARIKELVIKNRITRKKRGSSGKTKVKTKNKYKILREIEMTVAFDEDKYDIPKQNISLNRNSQGVKMKLKDKTSKDLIKLHAKQKSKTLNNYTTIGEFLKLVSEIYKKAEKNQIT